MQLSTPPCATHMHLCTSKWPVAIAVWFNLSTFARVQSGSTKPTCALTVCHRVELLIWLLLQLEAGSTSHALGLLPAFPWSCCCQLSCSALRPGPTGVTPSAACSGAASHPCSCWWRSGRHHHGVQLLPCRLLSPWRPQLPRLQHHQCQARLHWPGAHVRLLACGA